MAPARIEGAPFDAARTGADAARARPAAAAARRCMREEFAAAVTNPAGVRTRLVALCAAAVVVAPAAMVGAVAGVGQRTAAPGGVVASVGATSAFLGNGLVSRTWSLTGGVRTTALVGAGGAWAAPGDDFNVTVDGVPTSSTTGWDLHSPGG